MNDHTSQPSGLAFGGPGMTPKWTSSSKEGIGTAYSTSSRVWFTISHGILNEVYYPTIDRPQIRDLQFLITDGESFFHAEQRDLDTEIDCLENHVLGYRIVKTDRQGRYRILKEVISDPHQSCVLIRSRLEGDPLWLKRLQVYVLLAPHLECGGYGNSARGVRSMGQNVLVAWKGNTHLALGTNVGFARTSCGYVGSSDGWRDLNDNFAMDWTFERAVDGNIALTGQVDLSRCLAEASLPSERLDSGAAGEPAGKAPLRGATKPSQGPGRRPPSYEFTVGLAFGDGLHAAVTTLQQSLTVPFDEHRKRFIEQWHRVCGVGRFAAAGHAEHPQGQPLIKAAGDQGRLCHISHSLMLAHEDKTFVGGIIASASIPWGQVRGDEDLGGYHLVWTRDMVHSAAGLLAVGDTATPKRALVYLACSQQADGGFPQSFWINGAPYWRGVQLDEVALPIILAWHMAQAQALEEFDPYPMVRQAAGFLIRNGPITEQERWEENSGYSPSTLATNIAALVCAAAFAAERGDGAAATYLAEYADFLEAHVERWTVTTQGALLPGVPRHYIRIHPAEVCECAPDENPNHGMLPIRNRPPHGQQEFPAKDIVDAGFLELVRLGIRRPGDPLIEDSLRVVDSVLKVTTPYGPCWRRYNYDGYGERPDGRPFEGWGQGRAWPLLTGERGHYEFACGRDAAPYVRAMEGFASRGGMLPEQVWDAPEFPEAGMVLGRPAGSAMPLVWAHAEYVQLLRSIADGKVFDLIPIVAERYLGSRKNLFRGEIWKPNRQVRRAAPGQVLRIQTPEPFRLHWTGDEWRHPVDTDSTSTGLGVDYVDIPLAADQKAPIRFTFFWTRKGEWAGRDYAVEIAP